MTAKRAFLLLELLIASVVICITGVAISSSFSREIEMTGILEEIFRLTTFAEQKIFEIELKLREMEKAEQLDNYELSGTFPRYEQYSWNCTVKPAEQNKGLYVVDLEIIGNKRDINLVKWVNLEFPEADKQEKKENET